MKRSAGALLIIVAALLGGHWRAPAAEPDQAAAPASAGDPHAQLRRILDQPLYQRWKLRQEGPDASASESGESELSRSLRRWRESLAQWLEDLLNRGEPDGFRGLSSLGGAGLGGKLRFAGWIVLAAAVAFSLLVLYRYLRDRRAGHSNARVLSREQVREALVAGEALALATPDWIREADRLARERDFRAVYRALYLALLSGLHQAGKIDFRKNRTNWTYVHRYRGPESEQAVFRALTALFDTVWYGFKPAEGASMEGIKRQVTVLLAGDGQSA
jgi:hypothetical protein